MTEDTTKDSPDKDKGLELTDDKPPDMGKGEELVEGKVAKEGEEEELTPEIEAIMKKKGFKDPSELAKAYKAQEKKQTELEKDARLRSLIPSEIPERPKVEREFTPFPKLTKEPYNMSEEELDEYLTQREKAQEERLVAKYEDAEADKKWRRDHEEVMKVVRKDPERFEEIKPQLRILHNKYPDAPLSEIYPMADEMEKTQAKERADKFRAEILGGDIDPDKLKTLVSKLRPPVVSDAGGAGATGTGKKKPEDAIWEGIKASDVRRE